MTDGWSLTVTGHDLPEDVQASYFSSNGFNYFGVPTALGRGIIPSDAIDGQDPQPVVVLSYKFWQRHFNSDPTVIGQTIQLVRKNYTIIGVAAPRFTWDDGDVYLPLKVTQDPVHSYYVGLRLKPGVTHEMANAALAPLIEQFAKDSPKHFPKDRAKFTVIGLNEDFVHDLGGTLALLFTAVAPAARRSPAAATSPSSSWLAAPPGNMSSPSAQPSVPVAAASSASSSPSPSCSHSPEPPSASHSPTRPSPSSSHSYPNTPSRTKPPSTSISPCSPSPSSSRFSPESSSASGPPSNSLAPKSAGQIMQSGTRKIAGGVRGRTTNNVLIASQIALTLLMLAGAGAAIQGFMRLLHTPLGYDPHNVMSVGIPVHDSTYKTWDARSAYFEQLVAKVATVPGINMVAISTNATPPSNGWETPVEILGKPAQDEQKTRVNFVSPGYFPLLRIPVLHGKIWDETENHHAAHLAVINETMARIYFPNGDAIGHSLKVPDLKDEAALQPRRSGFRGCLAPKS